MSMFMCPAVHTTTRSLLRLSSTHEPSDPPLRVIMFFFEFLGELQPHGLHSPESDVFRPSSLNGYGLYRCFKKGYLQITLKSQALVIFPAFIDTDKSVGITASPKTSLNHSIGSSDGRCVQRAGT
ncbi:hypothetical protein GE061_020188 [Apolygus lucorum]|uniref:Uncharacterized protein n=1 Tax=Apolygus lucorum TaxID=248454 RepID=A0A8S9WJZ9_APOLU|nr:hypothetical protein GE061_020188 [Apolygus lucorum]